MSILQDALVGGNLVQLYGDLPPGPPPAPPVFANPGGQTGKRKVVIETLLTDLTIETGFTVTLTSPEDLQLTGAPAEVRPTYSAELVFDTLSGFPPVPPLGGFRMAADLAAATDRVGATPATITINCPVLDPGPPIAALVRLTVDWHFSVTN